VLRWRDLGVRFLAQVWLSLVWIVGGRRGASGPAVLAIDSGDLSWRFIDYEELLESAREYMGEDRVVKVTITDRERYVRQVRHQVLDQGVSHYFYDPRSASERPLRSWVQAFSLATLLAWRGITPISRMTDVHHRRWRAQTTLMSARVGIVTALMAPDRARSLAVHRRLVGPLPMPLSGRTYARLRQIRKEETVRPGSVVFVGLLYHPRSEFLREVERLLGAAGVKLEMRVREAGGPRISNDEYWRTLMRADVIISSSVMSQGPGRDRIDESHLIYRFTEACAVGRPLVAQAVAGGDHVFKSGRDFFGCTDAASAVKVILNLLRNTEVRERVADAGATRAAQLVSSNYFWRTIDSSLGGVLSAR
jgi:glycosyltransferase involved in cell wall biosynthesis